MRLTCGTELTHYRFKIDKHTSEITRQLPDKNNHVIDALRYAVENIRRNPPADTRYASSGPTGFSTALDLYYEHHCPSWGNPIEHAQRRDQAANLHRLMWDGYGW